MMDVREVLSENLADMSWTRCASRVHLNDPPELLSLFSHRQDSQRPTYSASYLSQFVRQTCFSSKRKHVLLT